MGTCEAALVSEPGSPETPYTEEAPAKTSGSQESSEGKNSSAARLSQAVITERCWRKRRAGTASASSQGKNCCQLRSVRVTRRQRRALPSGRPGKPWHKPLLLCCTVRAAGRADELEEAVKNIQCCLHKDQPRQQCPLSP